MTGRGKGAELALVLCAVFCVVMAMPLTGAEECEYGTVNAWARTLTKDGTWGPWREATVHGTLLAGEPFQIKVVVTPKVNCTLALWLCGAGATKAYEVISGSTSSLGIDGELKVKEIHATEIFRWTVRPTANWTRGTAALNVFTQLSAQDKDKRMEFTIIAAYIKDRGWQGNIPGEESGSMPGLPVPGSMASILAGALLAARTNRRSATHG